MRESILRQKNGGVLAITFDRYPKRNSISRSMLADIQGALGDCADDVHVVMFRGANGFFSAGADIGELTGSSADRSFDEELGGVTDTIRNLSAVSIAVIEGGCIGAGLDLACACDLRIGARSAFFAVPAVELGLLYNPRAVARMHAILPDAAIRRMFLLGERLNGEAASAAGLLDQLVADSEIDAAIEKLTSRILSSAPASKATGRLLASLRSGSFDPAYWQEEYLKIINSPERHTALSRRKKKPASR